MQTFNDVNGLGTGLAAWTAAAGGNVQGVDLSGSVTTFDPLTGDPTQFFKPPSITTPTGVVMTLVPTNTFHRDLVGYDWGTWSNGSTPFILDTLSQDTLTLTLSANLAAFGLELEPFDNAFFMSVTLNTASGTEAVINSAGPVNADAGAQFFGWTGATDLTSITLTCIEPTDPNAPSCFDPTGQDGGFALGNLVVAVPEPASISLFAAGLVGFGAWRRRRSA